MTAAMSGAAPTSGVGPPTASGSGSVAARGRARVPGQYPGVPDPAAYRGGESTGAFRVVTGVPAGAQRTGQFPGTQPVSGPAGAAGAAGAAGRSGYGHTGQIGTSQFPVPARQAGQAAGASAGGATGAWSTVTGGFSAITSTSMAIRRQVAAKPGARRKLLITFAISVAVIAVLVVMSIFKVGGSTATSPERFRVGHCVIQSGQSAKPVGCGKDTYRISKIVGAKEACGAGQAYATLHQPGQSDRKLCLSPYTGG